MKTKKGTRKLEFKKETIARLGEGQLNGIQGGTGSPNNSWDEGGQCTQGLRTRIAKATCVGPVCNKTL